MDGLPLVEWLRRQLEDPGARPTALEAVKDLGRAAEVLLDRLADFLGDPYWLVRKLTAEALASMGQSAAREDVLDRLVDLCALRGRRPQPGHPRLADRAQPAA